MKYSEKAMKTGVLTKSTESQPRAGTSTLGEHVGI